MIYPSIYPSTMSVEEWLSNRFIGFNYTDIRLFIGHKRLLYKVHGLWNAKKHFIAKEVIRNYNKQNETELTEGMLRDFSSNIRGDQEDPIRVYTDNKKALIHYICSRYTYDTWNTYIADPHDVWLSDAIGPVGLFSWDQWWPDMHLSPSFDLFSYCIVTYRDRHGDYLEVYKSLDTDYRKVLNPEGDFPVAYGLPKGLTIEMDQREDPAYVLPSRIEDDILLDIDMGRDTKIERMYDLEDEIESEETYY